MKNKLIDFLRSTLPFVIIMASTATLAFKQGFLWSEPNHQKITYDALRTGPSVRLSNGAQILFSDNAALEVMKANAATDLSNFNDPDFHFDNEKFDKSNENLIAFKTTIVTLAKDAKYEAARETLGTSLHLVQDFYAHSTWVERRLVDPTFPVPNLGTPNPFADPKLSTGPLATCNHSGLLPGAAFTSGWFDTEMAVIDRGWSTSDWYAGASLGWPNGRCVHGGDTGSGLNKDQVGRENFHWAYHYAIRGSRMFLDEVLAIMRSPGQGGDQAICGLLDQSSSIECRVPINISATTFVRGTNVALSAIGYGADTLMNAPPYGTAVNAAEWDFNVPVAGKYELFVEYAAALSRPVTIAFNGAIKFTSALTDITGGWFPADRLTLSQGIVALPAGANIMRVARTDVFPHIRGFKLVAVK